MIDKTRILSAWRFCAWMGLFIIIGAVPAHAQEKRALVIGNSSY